PAEKPDHFVDALLREAWKQRAQWEPELRLLDRIGQTFGLTSPRSLAEVETNRQRIETLRQQLESHGEDWTWAERATGAANERHFLIAHPEWKAKVGPGALRTL